MASYLQQFDHANARGHGNAALMSMFDDVWEIGYPMAMITMKRDSDGNTVRVLVGIEEVYNGKTGDDH